VTLTSPPPLKRSCFTNFVVGSIHCPSKPTSQTSSKQANKPGKEPPKERKYERRRIDDRCCGRKWQSEGTQRNKKWRPPPPSVFRAARKAHWCGVSALVREILFDPSGGGALRCHKSYGRKALEAMVEIRLSSSSLRSSSWFVASSLNMHALSSLDCLLVSGTTNAGGQHRPRGRWRKQP
jgi:hypothetical protein